MRVLSRVEVAERLTADEFFRDAPEDRKAELIDGVLVMPSPPLVTHERLFRFLSTLLTLFGEERELGEVFGSRTAVRLSALHVSEPDIFFVAKNRLYIVGEKGVAGAPDFVIEILSAGTVHNDRGAKFRAYERAGVQELWLLDPYGPAGTEFYRLHQGQFLPFMPDERGIVHAVAIPGFWMQTEWLWPAEAFLPVRSALAQILGE